jgi:hypothetical protein
MEQQNFKNHARIVPPFHYGLFGAIAICLALGIVAFFATEQLGWLLPLWMVLVSLCLVLSSFFGRQFAIKAQDRAHGTAHRLALCK